MRLDVGNPRREIASPPEIRRTTKTDWRDRSRDLWKQAFPGVDIPQQFPDTFPPWLKIAECEFRHTATEKKLSDEEKRRAGEEAIRKDEDDYDTSFYTDGSAEESNKNGGAGVVIVGKNSLEPPREHSFPAGRWTSSFQAEMIAIEKALEIAVGDCNENTKIRVITDSKSSVDRIDAMSQDLVAASGTESSIICSLNALGKKNVSVCFLWCPSHCGLWGNEAADKCADSGRTMPQNNIQWSYETAKAKIKREGRNNNINHPVSRKVYMDEEGRVNIPKDEGLTREEQVTLSRLRSGHHPNLHYWRHKIEQEEEATCRLCGHDEETTEHVMTNCGGMADQYPQYWKLNNLVKDQKTALHIWTVWCRRVEAMTAEETNDTTPIPQTG
jgi:ribonuclease HI